VITEREIRKLRQSYGGPMEARTCVIKCAVGLLLLLAIALLGLTVDGQGTPTSTISASQAAAGR
jgi:hypothetical protein